MHNNQVDGETPLCGNMADPFVLKRRGVPHDRAEPSAEPSHDDRFRPKQGTFHSSFDHSCMPCLALARSVVAMLDAAQLQYVDSAGSLGRPENPMVHLYA